MKRAMILGLAVVLLVMAVTPAFAEDDTSDCYRCAYRFRLTGKVKEVDVEAGTITVSVIGYWPHVPVASLRIVIQTDEHTRFRWGRNSNTAEVRPPTIRDVRVGEKIAVRGVFRNGVHLARLVILRLPNADVRPTPTPTAQP